MRYAKIKENDISNGDGICVSLFTQGCSKHCEGCFNPETWDFDGGIEIDNQEMIDKILILLHKNNVSRDLNLLGGEPFDQPYFIMELIQQVKTIYPETKIWVWTGYTIEELLNKNDKSVQYILNHIDVLIDGPYEAATCDLTLRYSGSRNQRVHYLKKGESHNG